MKASKNICARCGKTADCYDTSLFVAARDRFTEGRFCEGCIAEIYKQAQRARKDTGRAQ